MTGRSYTCPVREMPSVMEAEELARELLQESSELLRGPHRPPLAGDLWVVGHRWQDSRSGTASSLRRQRAVQHHVNIPDRLGRKARGEGRRYAARPESP